MLQRAKAMDNTKHNCARIQFRIDCWNHGVFEKLVKYMHNAATLFLGKSCGIQGKDQYHCKLSNLILKGKLQKTVRFVCARETWGVLQPKKLAEDRTGVINKTVTSVLMVKYPHKNPLLFYVGEIQ